MTFQVASLMMLLLAAPAKATKLDLGTRLFTEGDFDGALKALDVAALESVDPTVLERVQLVRGQCFAARQDFARAEEAFALALDSNPEATLDPARVDPTVVKLLDRLRARLVGTLVLSSTPPGAAVSIDGKASGKAPLTLEVAAGRHRVEAGWGDDTAATDVMVYPRRENRAQWVQVAGAGALDGRSGHGLLHPLGDVRASLEVPSGEPSPPAAWGLDFGGGFELGAFRLGAWARLFPFFGLTPRAAFTLPVLPHLALFLEAEVPLWFRSGGFAVGVGGGLGVEYSPLRSLGVFAQLGGQHLFAGHLDDTRFTATGGVRLRAP